MRHTPADLRRDGRLRNGARNALATLENWIRDTHRGRLVALIIEGPPMLIEDLNLTPTEDGRLVTDTGTPLPADVFTHLQAAVDAWEKLSPADRAAIGHVRYHFHVSGAVVVQRIDDPRKGKRALKA